MDASASLRIADDPPLQATFADAQVETAPADLMKFNLSQLFCETDPVRRAAAFDELWHEDALICEQGRTRAGRSAVLAVAASFSARMSGYSCAPASAVLDCDNFYFLKWEARDGERICSVGNHVALLRDGRIDTLFLHDD